MLPAEVLVLLAAMKADALVVAGFVLSAVVALKAGHGLLIQAAFAGWRMKLGDR
jgi:hypothetical protein